MTTKATILHAQGRHYVISTTKGYEVYRNEGVAAVRCASIGYQGEKGLRYAIDECARREADPRWMASA